MPSMDLAWEISPAEVKAALAAGQALVLVDVRTDEELAIASLAGAEHIPMDEVPAKLQRIEAASDQARVIVMCHHGVRSMNVTAWLRQQGVANCQSMSGGIDMWSLTVDHSIPRY
jgi:rhodanese-related sulfurtransferase